MNGNTAYAASPVSNLTEASVYMVSLQPALRVAISSSNVDLSLSRSMVECSLFFYVDSV